LEFLIFKKVSENSNIERKKKLECQEEKRKQLLAANKEAARLLLLGVLGDSTVSKRVESR